MFWMSLAAAALEAADAGMTVLLLTGPNDPLLSLRDLVKGLEASVFAESAVVIKEEGSACESSASAERPSWGLC